MYKLYEEAWRAVLCNPCKAENSEQHRCNPTFDHSLGCNGRVALFLFLLIDSTQRKQIDVIWQDILLKANDPTAREKTILLLVHK